MKDITRAIHARDVDPTELAQLLQQRFQQAQFTSEVQVDLPDAGSPVITLMYTRKGVLAQVLSSLDNEQIDEIVLEVESKLLATTRPLPSRRVLFANTPVKGQWKSGLFTLAEAPSNAPRPPYLLGDHPLIMALEFDAIDDSFFNIQRADRLHHEYSLLLSVFVPGIRPMTNVTRSHWGISTASNPPGEPILSSWFQEFYDIPGFDRFGDPGDPEVLIELVEDATYYAQLGIMVGESLKLPSSLTRWVDGYAFLPAPAKRRFLRAAYWLRHSQQMFTTSQSASLIASVQTVESLLRPDQGIRCPTCGLMQGAGPTALFERFLDKHVGATGSPARKQLYKQRSQLAHGHELLTADEEIVFGWQSPRSPHEDGVVRDANRLARAATISWLEEQLTSPTHPR